MTTHKAHLIQVKNRLEENLRSLSIQTSSVTFSLELLNPSIKKRGISISYDAPNGETFEQVITGYSDLIAITASYNGLRQLTLLPVHTSLHERYLKECAAIYEVLYRAYLKLTSTIHPVSDLASIAKMLAPYLCFILVDEGDSKDDALQQTWSQERSLRGSLLSHIIYDFWYGRLSAETIFKHCAQVAQLLNERAKAS